MTIQELADVHVGHSEELDEDCVITAQRESFKCGGLKVLEEIESWYYNSLQPAPLSNLLYKIKELKCEL